MVSSAPAAEAPRPLQRLSRWGERGLAIAVFVATCFLLFGPVIPNGPELLSTALTTRVIFLIIGLPLAVSLWRVSAPGAVRNHPLFRLLRWGLAIVLVGMAVARMTVLQYHSKNSKLLASQLETDPADYARMLMPVEAAEWALRLALHAAADLPASDTPPAIPTDWPFPSDTRLAVQRDAAGRVEFWSRTEGTKAVVLCHATSTTSTTTLTAAALTPTCTTGAATPLGVEFVEPKRTASESVGLPADSAPRPWLQHRVDALRSGTVTGAALPAITTGWRVATPTPVRASASVVGNRVLVGGHGTGLITALDLASGATHWVARVPNWIHQEPVSDGRVLVVGFGDNKGSFDGRAPSGVAAYSVESGRRLWTRFDESSVMTSPIISDSVLLYISSGGLVRKRLLSNGNLLGRINMQGSVPMGPPVLRGDTLVVTLDPNQVCAVQASTMRTLWCQRVAGMRMMGHSSATPVGDFAILSGVGSAVTPSLTDFVKLPALLQLRLLKTMLFPQYTEYNTAAYAGQRFYSISLADGAPAWSSQFFAARRQVDGHTAGTSVVHDSVGVVVLPVSDTVVAFDVRSGKTLWTSGGHRARGPALILSGQVLVAGRDGVIQLRDLHSGALTCQMKRPIGFDRAGPALARGLLIFVTLEGEVEAVPEAELLQCVREQQRASQAR